MNELIAKMKIAELNYLLSKGYKYKDAVKIAFGK